MSQPFFSSTILPIQLEPYVQDCWDNLQACLTGQQPLLADPVFAASFRQVSAGSQFIVDTCLRHPDVLADLWLSGTMQNRHPESYFLNALTALTFADEAGLMRQLRQFRRREMLRIAWRDLAGWADLAETLSDLSHLADACVQTALAFLYREACTRRGTPLLPDGRPQQLVVLGMGKLGAYELNFSSDIDLIFAYPQDGVLPDKKATSYGEFFSKLCHSLIKTLDAITADGLVFRTDIRLRPFGDSGAVVMNFDGMEHYYQTQAREWERYAMIKVRQIAGDFNAGAELLKMLQAFVYRRYLDYGAFEELRGLKTQIMQELKRKDRLDNIKLGAGGIREIEFIGQAFQLIRGGHEKSLQQRGILAVLKRLGELGYLTAEDTKQLIASYQFLRRTENHLQAYQDLQTHHLPTEPFAQLRLAYSMGFADWPDFKAALDQVRQRVHAVFGQVFAAHQTVHGDAQPRQIWALADDDPTLQHKLGQLGFAEPAKAVEVLRHFKQAAAIRRLSAKSAVILDRLMPDILAALPCLTNPDSTLKRVLTLLETIAGRSVYFALLAENPGALAQLLRLAAAGAWFGDTLARYPVLFDELIDPRSLLAPLSGADLATELSDLLAQVDSQDLERLMIVLREFKQQQVLKVAAADVTGVIPLMVVSDYLTTIAETIVQHTVRRAWQMLLEKHGLPPGSDRECGGFAVLGFGKLGGFELGYGSDLDLVFICNYPDGQALTDGDKAISCAQFYGRLGQKIRHILDTRLLSGILYEVDMRLRPSGDSGLLVAHLNSYEDYLRHNAWTWEHQALVRGRFIAGDWRLKTAFEDIRQRILCLPRSYPTLKREVREMREKMRAHLADKTAGQFDLKHSLGGIADIEFIVQFLVLAHAQTHPQLTRYTDNIRLLDTLASAGLLPETTAQTLKAAYCHYRDLGHKLTLQASEAVLDAAEVADFQIRVAEIWRVEMVD